MWDECITGMTDDKTHGAEEFVSWISKILESRRGIYAKVPQYFATLRPSRQNYLLRHARHTFTSNNLILRPLSPSLWIRNFTSQQQNHNQQFDLRCSPMPARTSKLQNVHRGSLASTDANWCFSSSPSFWRRL